MYEILSLLIILYGKGLVKGYFIVVFLQRKILEFKLSIGKAVGGCGTCAAVVWLVLLSSFRLFNIVLGATPHRLQVPCPKLSKGGGGISDYPLYG
jgi:hypothetical protein